MSGDVTLIGADAPAIPFFVGAYLIEVKQYWAQEWRVDPTIHGAHVEAPVAGAGMSLCSISRFYGRAKNEFDTDFQTQLRLDLTRWWVRVRILTESGGESDAVTIFQGQVLDPSIEIDGADNGDAGTQSWLVYGAEMLLSRLEIAHTFWNGTGDRIEWLPAFNVRHADERGIATVTGNRTATVGSAGVFEFGGQEEWNNLQMLQYLIVKHVQQPVADDPPAWTVSGQLDALAALTSRITLREKVSAFELLREIVPMKLGFDYRILPTAGGFEVAVFTLAGEASSFAGVTIPANPNKFQLDASTDASIGSPKIESSDAQKYDSVRAFGRRGVTCFSFSLDSGLGQGLKGWDDVIQLMYKLDSDRGRNDEFYADVFSRFILDPAFWASALAADRRPRLLGTADPTTGLQKYDIAGAPVQTNERATLPHLPLLTGVDYSQASPVDHNPAGTDPSYMPPMFFIYFRGRWHNAATLSQSIDDTAPNYRIQPLKRDWGLRVSVLPRHMLAKGHWSGAADAEFNPDTYQGSGLFDWEDCVMTIAIEMDQPLSVQIDLPAEQQAGNGAILELHVSDAEWWYLNPSTMLGVDANGNVQLAQGGVLRDDTPRLAAVAAGAAVTYLATRTKANVLIRRLIPYSGLLGQWFESVTSGATVQQIGAPLTKVVYDLQKMTTTLRTGYANK